VDSPLQLKIGHGSLRINWQTYVEMEDSEKITVTWRSRKMVEEMGEGRSRLLGRISILHPKQDLTEQLIQSLRFTLWMIATNRKDFKGLTLEYMQGYRDGQEYLRRTQKP